MSLWKTRGERERERDRAGERERERRVRERERERTREREGGNDFDFTISTSNHINFAFIYSAKFLGGIFKHNKIHIIKKILEFFVGTKVIKYKCEN